MLDFTFQIFYLHIFYIFFFIISCKSFINLKFQIVITFYPSNNIKIDRQKKQINCQKLQLEPENSGIIGRRLEDISYDFELGFPMRNNSAKPALQLANLSVQIQNSSCSMPQEIILVGQKTIFHCLCCYGYQKNNKHFAHHCAKTYRIYSNSCAFSQQLVF